MMSAGAVRAQRAFAVRISALFAAIFVVAGTNLPFLPIWLDWAGLSLSQIAVVTAVPLFVRVAVTPAIALAADRAGDHRRFLIGLAWIGLAALLTLAQCASFWPILLCTVAFALAWTTIMPLTETLAMSGVRAADLDYGRMRLWGSLSFIAASFCGGWVVDRLGAASAVWLIIFGGVLTVAAAHMVPHPIADEHVELTPSQRRIGISDAAALLGSRPFLVFLLATGAVQAAHAVFYTFGTLHWRSLGLSTGWSGLLWSVGVITEIGLFAFSRAVLRKIEPVSLITIGCLAAVLRWIAMGFDPPIAGLLPLQALHGLTYGAAHVGAIHYIGRTVPGAQSGTAQALYASVTGGIAMGGTMLVAGPLYAGFGGRAYWAMALVAALGLCASLALARLCRRPHPHRSLVGG